MVGEIIKVGKTGEYSSHYGFIGILVECPKIEGGVLMSQVRISNNTLNFHIDRKFLTERVIYI